MLLATIPIPQKVSFNEVLRMHWAKRKPIVDTYSASLIEYRHLRLDLPVYLHFDFTFAGRALDADNCAFMLKELVDSMRHWDIIPNDTPGCVSGTSMTSKKGSRDEVAIHALTSAQVSAFLPSPSPQPSAS